MGKTVNGEYCPNALDDFVERGDFYAGIIGGRLVVHHGSEHGYPLGSSAVLGVSMEEVPALIAVLRAAQTKYAKGKRQ